MSYGSLIIAESLLVMYIGMGFFGLDSNIEKLRTFTFVWLTLSGYYIILSIWERKHFWNSKPSLWLTLALILNTAIVYIISTIGLPGLASITSLEFFILAYGFVACLLINDLVKVPLIKIFGVVL